MMDLHHAFNNTYSTYVQQLFTTAVNYLVMDVASFANMLTAVRNQVLSKIHYDI